MKIIFMGTPDFAAASLAALLETSHEITAVFTQPDKPVGRKQLLMPPPVKELALSRGIPVYQPVSLKSGEASDIISAAAPDIIVVAAYGKILPENILNIPKLGCVNVHGSLLPKYRGAAPVQWAVINGEETTGITTMQMDAGIDTGDILETAEISIHPEETAGELFARLAGLGAELIVKTIDNLAAGRLIPVPQNNAEATHAPMLSRENSPVSWTRSAREIHNQIRGLNPWPGAVTNINGIAVKLWKSEISVEKSALPPGTPVIFDDSLDIVCGDGGIINIKELQPAGKKKMPAEIYLRGQRGEIEIKGI